MRTISCSRCGKKLPEGINRYTVDIIISAGFDDTDDIYGELDDGHYPDEINRMQEDLDRISCFDLDDDLDDLVQEVSLILCEDCKERFQETLFKPAATSVAGVYEIKGTIH